MKAGLPTDAGPRAAMGNSPHPSRLTRVRPDANLCAALHNPRKMRDRKKGISMAQLGADVEQLDLLGRKFDEEAQKIEATISTISAQLTSTCGRARTLRTSVTSGRAPIRPRCAKWCSGCKPRQPSAAARRISSDKSARPDVRSVQHVDRNNVRVPCGGEQRYAFSSHMGARGLDGRVAARVLSASCGLHRRNDRA